MCVCVCLSVSACLSVCVCARVLLAGDDSGNLQIPVLAFLSVLGYPVPSHRWTDRPVVIPSGRYTHAHTCFHRMDGKTHSMKRIVETSARMLLQYPPTAPLLVVHLPGAG